MSRTWLHAVDWKFVFLATGPLWLFIIGIVAWQKLTPKAFVQKPPHCRPLQHTTPKEYNYDPFLDDLTFVVANPPVNPFVVTTNLPEKPIEIDPEVAEFVGDQLKELFRGLLAAKREAVVMKPQAAKLERLLPDGFKTHGTEVAFARTLADANKKAKVDNKLVFVLHLSGNIESDGFT